MDRFDFHAFCRELLDKYDMEWRARERIKDALKATPPPEPQSSTIERLLRMPGSSWVKYSPWEQEGYCDEQGRCWFQQYGKWILAHPESIVNVVCCLPAYVNPKVTQ